MDGQLSWWHGCFRECPANKTRHVLRRFLGDCNFSGTLPSAWALPTAFPSLQTLDVHSNSLDGGLPAAWGSQVCWTCHTERHL